jgi:hypothetical protein
MLTHIELGEKQRPILFGWGAATIMEEESGRPFPEFAAAFAQSKYTAKDVVLLAYAGLANGCEYTDTPVDFTVRKVGAWLDAAHDPTLLTRLMELFVKGFPQVEQGEEGAQGKKTKPRTASTR